MRAIALLVAATGGALLVAAPNRAEAQDASFGCKVLLCAAASSPGWSGIPYCVPVMQQLFQNLAHGGGWPSCPEGNASGLGYEPYEPCATGLTPVQSVNNGVEGMTPAPNGNLCADLSKPQQICTGRGSCATTYPTTAREARSDPYYVDISTANGTQRFYFSLQGF